MSDRTQDLKNLRAVATACKNYVDETKEQILWQVGQYNITTQDDNTTAYQKVVPTGATRGKLKSIGFMSYKSENLIVLQNATETSLNGVDTSISSGVITSNGTATSSGNVFRTSCSPITLKANQTYTIWSNVTNGNFSAGMQIWIGNTNNETVYNTGTYSSSSQRIFSKQITPTEDTLIDIVRIYSNNGNSFNSNIYIMIIEGTTEPTKFKQGFTGIRDSIVTSVKSYGANLIDTTDYTLGGDAYNASITITKQLQVGTTYTLSYDSSISSNVTLTNATLVSASGYISRTSIAFTPTSNNVVITFAGGSTSNPLRTKLNDMVWFMLNYGSTALPYKAYRGLIDTFTIPSEVQALDGYGRGINENCYNVLDLEAKIFTDKDNRITFNGTENWQRSDTNDTTTKGYYFYIEISDCATVSSGSDVSDIFATYFNAGSPNSIYGGAQTGGPYISYWTGSNHRICIYDRDNLAFKTVAEFKQWLADKYTNGNPIVVNYKLATLIETDVSQYITNNVIEVEEGGYLVFENQYGQAVPSNITYRIEVAK